MTSPFDMERIGDRYQWVGDDSDDEPLIIEVIQKNLQIVISSSKLGYAGNYPGRTGNWSARHNENWRYLGNFAKADNFNSLYEKLANE